VESALSLIPSAKPLPLEILYATEPQIQSGISAVDAFINPALAQSMTAKPGDSVNPVLVWTAVLSWVCPIRSVFMT